MPKGTFVAFNEIQTPILVINSSAITSVDRLCHKKTAGRPTEKAFPPVLFPVLDFLVWLTGAAWQVGTAA